MLIASRALAAMRGRGIVWGLVAAIAAPALGQQQPSDLKVVPPEPVALDAKPVTVESHINAVTAYLGRAAVTRVAQLDLSPGVYDLRFAGLPESIQPQTLQARAGGPAKVVGVEFETKQVAAATSPKLAELDAKIEKVRLSLEEVAEQHKINAAQGELLDQIGVRIADDASKGAGSEKLNLPALREQIAFMGEERGKLMTRRAELDARKRQLDDQMRLLQAERTSVAGDAGKADRIAVVTCAVSAPSQVSVELTYLVANATWEPRYNIRAASDGSSVTIEYNALLQQRTGEDWDDVRLTLSTAQPMLAANPPALQPWHVSLVEQAGGRGGGGGIGGGIHASAEERARKAGEDETDQLHYRLQDQGDIQATLGVAVADASVGGAGPAVTFQLPRLVTVKTSADREQTARIAIVDTQPKFAHVAIPALTPAVYIRGDLANASDYQFLPGAASVFVGQDYVGPTTLPAVAPKGEFKVHFGIDPAVKASRQRVANKTSKTGLFSGGLRTSRDYRIEIDNGAGKAIDVELWDRIPVSDTDRVKIELTDLSKPLATDAEYTSKQKPEGLLKWVYSVPAYATGKSADVVTYGVRVDRAADVQHTPIPD